MIGRAPCPECGFSSAHIKQSEKCLYRYCPECGAQFHAKTERQRADLMTKTRTIEQADTTASPSPTASPTPAADPSTTPTVDAPTPSGPSPTGSEDSKPEPKPKRRGLFT